MIEKLFLILVPMIVVAGVFVFMLDRFFKEERKKRDFRLRLENSKNILPNKLQAYERLALFLERIRPSALVRRIAPAADFKAYEYVLIETIQTEFEHNLAQQIYINPETWKIIFSAKNATQLFVQDVAKGMDISATAADLQEEILKKAVNENSPSSMAMLYLQKDIY
ncbi:MAG: hypothetical protein LBT29_08735 [Flavobacteriaceae bacterium]|jgi:hypothetical protein|nr:hypothetical protein [Flavobacteriaceae bacterium]